MPTWLRKLVRECVAVSVPVVTITPVLAAFRAYAEVEKQQWLAQGLWFMAASYSLTFVIDSIYIVEVLAFGGIALAYATSPRTLTARHRIVAAVLSWVLFLYPLQQLVLPTFRRLTVQNEKDWLPFLTDGSIFSVVRDHIGDYAFLISISVPQSLMAMTALWGIVGWLTWRWRCAHPLAGARLASRTLELRRWALVPTLVLLPSILLLGFDAPKPPEKAPNIVFIICDTLRADHLGMYGYETRETSPHLDDLATESVVYQNAVSTAPWTTPSVASMLTSRYPRRLGYGQHPAYLAPKEVTVAEVLRNRGYRTHAITSNTFAGRSVGFDAGFEWMDFSLAAGQMDVTSGDLTDHAIAWLDENGDQPFFLYLHYFDPHFAYVMHPEFKFDYVYDGPMRDQESHTEFTLSMPSLTQADVDWVTAAYDSEIAYTDQYIGQLLDHLRAKGLYDNTLIVFVGDHGEAFNDRGDHYIGHARTVWQELLHVPLIVKMPGGDGAGTNVLTRVSTMDIAPTILAAAGASFPESEPIDGKPLSTAPMDRLLISETRRDANLRAAFQGHWKLIVDRDKKTSALYDLEADPGEKHDVSAEHRDIADKLEVSVDVWENSLGHHNSAAAPFSADAIQRLKGLGYWQ